MVIGGFCFKSSYNRVFFVWENSTQKYLPKSMLDFLRKLILSKTLYNQLYIWMKVSYEKAIEVNNQLKANVDQQQDDIKHLNVQCNKDKVQEISGARIPIKKRKNLCVSHVIKMDRKQLFEKPYHERAHDPV